MMTFRGARVSRDGGEAATASTARDDDVVARARWGSGCDTCASGADEYEEANEASGSWGREKGGVGS